jgi:hypothetical protein
MNQYFFLAGIITILYLVVKQIESRYVSSDEPKPLKLVVRDCIFVFGCSMVTLFVANLVDTPFKTMMSMVTDTVITAPVINVHTDPPNW